MAPDAELGDISLGQTLDPDEQAFVVNLANRRRNTALNEALLLGLLDRQRELLWVRLEPPGGVPGAVETRVVLRPGLEDLQRAGLAIPEVRTIKEAGTPGIFTGERCRALRIPRRALSFPLTADKPGAAVTAITASSRFPAQAQRPRFSSEYPLPMTPSMSRSSRSRCRCAARRATVFSCHSTQLR